MATFRILDQAPQFLLPDGQVNAGGYMWTFENDLSTEKLTWSDPDKTTPNSNPILLNAEGRTVTDVWGEGEYGIEMQDAAGQMIWTRNNVEIPGGTGTAIPALVSGAFLSNNGVILQWLQIASSLIPDPTGSTGYILSNDGVNPIWIPQPAAPDVPIEDGSDYTIIGDQMHQWGSGTAPASGFRQTSTSVNFGTAFGGTPHFVGITPTNATHTSGGQIGVAAVTSKSTTGFGVQFDTDDFGESNAEITGALTFDWYAIGPKP